MITLSTKQLTIKSDTLSLSTEDKMLYNSSVVRNLGVYLDNTLMVEEKAECSIEMMLLSNPEYRKTPSIDH